MTAGKVEIGNLESALGYLDEIINTTYGLETGAHVGFLKGFRANVYRELEAHENTATIISAIPFEPECLGSRVTVQIFTRIRDVIQPQSLRKFVGVLEYYEYVLEDDQLTFRFRGNTHTHRVDLNEVAFEVIW